MKSRLPVLILAAVASARLGSAQAQSLPLTDGRWELKGASATLERHDGRDALAVENGFAYRRDVRLQDGSVDFDVQVTRRRSFVYLMFRMASDHEHEEMYLRPHKSSLPDAIQYAPVYQGASAWQLYHGPGATAAVTFEPGAWTHVRLVLQGEKAAVFVGDLVKPALVIPRLARPAAPGYLALRAFAPRGSGSGPVARFANVSIQPGASPFDFSSGKSDEAADQAAASVPAAGLRHPGSVRAWSVSRAFAVPKDGPCPHFPPPTCSERSSESMRSRAASSSCTGT
jgi:hypothetical protein